jgi:hypothetical protein
MEVWMLSEDRSLPELARLCQEALETIGTGIGDSPWRKFRQY